MTIYVCDNKQNVVEENLKVASEVMLKWFKYNTISANPDKFQFMILGKNVTNIDHITIGNIDVPPSENVKLLGITIDKNLDFQKHINQLCRKANYKTFALRRIRQYIGVDTALTLYRSYIYSNFLYCPLISFGREFHCIEALNFTEFKPYLTEFASGKVKRFFLLKSYFVSLKNYSVIPIIDFR